LLGTFELTGIVPAPKGTPKIDISFDLDANGILKVTAVDKATGRANQIIISNHKGRLSDSQIKKMIDEAEKNKEEDAKFRKKVDARNELESYALQVQSAMNDLQKLNLTEKKAMQESVSHTLNWLEENGNAELEQIQSKKRELEGLCAPIITKLYNS